MTFLRGPFNYHMEIQGCEKITRNTLPPKVLGISGAPHKTTDFQRRLKLYVHIKGMRDLGSSTEGARI